MRNYFAYLVTIIGASFWGLTGLFVDGLYKEGFTAWEIVAIRLTISTIILMSLIAIIAPGKLRIQIKHIPHFIGLGVCGIVLFNWFYFTVMTQTSISIAVVLLYTAPVFVTVLSRYFFNEPITNRKIVSLVLSIFGCSLAIQLIPVGHMQIPFISVAFGLLSAFFCGLYSIIGKKISRHYNFLTTTVYALCMGSVFILPTSGLWNKIDAFQSFDVWFNIGGIVIISTISAYTLYTYGLTHIESSKAAILGALEPIVAVLIGVIIFDDHLSFLQVIGILLVISAAFVTVYHRQRIIYRHTKTEQ
ncbi:Threonine/homoserine efflux transporter RhtA [Gracilibacillus orientalis]|uniref:Threonine/homoserine efflux transporter RhtA n=1 Tax=Gracilibacillus orientalis TaxID=334253 RepID=A0A1I4MS68_9BACI|nr:EamA family transporter [Gracilibacillus orientalis]SFM06089.1 Threonine/homoserine efflux transporter RhtA [Gracilibacillus orientalis]